MIRRLKAMITLPVGVLMAALSITLLAGGAVALDSVTSDDPKAQLDAQMDEARQAAIQQALEHPELQPSKNPTLWPTGTPEPWPQGLFQRGPAPFPSASYVVESTWQWDLDGNHVQVFAGCEGVEGAFPGRGVIVVLVTSIDLKSIPFSGQYSAPIGVGTLKIVDFEGTDLQIEADTGETFHFDAQTREFTDEEGAPVPTDAPIPTKAPLPTTTATLPPIPTEEPSPGPASSAP